jgi:hypothetical protein
MAFLWAVALIYLTAQQLFTDDHPYPQPLIVFAGLLAVTVAVGVLRTRAAIHSVAFTRAHVLLERRAGQRTIATADLTEVSIRHTGDSHSGYNATTLRLTGRDGPEDLDCPHLPDLAESLRSLLPAHVTVPEQWDELYNQID